MHIIKVSVMRHLRAQIQICAPGTWSISDPDVARFFGTCLSEADLVYLSGPSASQGMHRGCRRLAMMYFLGWTWFLVFSFFLSALADLDCLLLLEWIKCATDRARVSAVTLWVDLSATFCLHLVKTGRVLISPGSHKLDCPTCCPDLLLIFPLSFKGRERKCAQERRGKKTSIEF